ncbi:hypothetical protein [Delftia sp. PS-11]|uniref:hypothetical protein n=1 Tax=Delftia sp. PS-11 TaxID=2767222 RepID=UPI0024546B30|nr:hypothetical protein [Delftia sp. PS-11]KAJ8745455.1 hypothetical protein H9T68_06560 [Delftia sp. PS-11]
MTQIQITGALLQDAEVRTMPLGEGRTPMPVLTLLIDTDGPAHMPVRAEQVYPPSLRHHAEAAARALRKGMRVAVDAPTAQIRTTLGYCSAITPLRKAGDITPKQSKEAAHG